MIIDVRTPEEYLFVGHPTMAWNIPVFAQSYEWDAAKQQFPMKPLPDFVARVQGVAKPDATLLVTCRAGGRAAMAINMLAQAGFKQVYNIVDGVEGDPVDDPGSVFHGMPMRNGWKNSGLSLDLQTQPRTDGASQGWLAGAATEKQQPTEHTMTTELVPSTYAKMSVLTFLLAALALPGLAQQPTAAERAAQLKAASWPPARSFSASTNGLKPPWSASRARRSRASSSAAITVPTAGCRKWS